MSASRGYSVTPLRWRDPPLATLDLPKRAMEIVAGFGSGLTRRDGDPPGVVWAVGDRGPNIKVNVALDRYGIEAVAHHGKAKGAKVMPRPDIAPALAELRITGDTVELVRTLPLRGASGKAISGLPIPGGGHAENEPAIGLNGEMLTPDPSGADTEGIVALPDGGFIVGDEYGPSLLRLDADGRILVRWVPQGCERSFEGADYPVAAVLPAIAAKRQLNRGFEALAISPDGQHLHLAFQSPLAHPDSHAHEHARHVRVWTLDAASGEVRAQYLYRLDEPGSFTRDENAKRDDVKVSEMAALPDGGLIVLERVSKTTKLYRVALTDPLRAAELDLTTRPTLEERSMAGEDLPALAKTLLLDSAAAPELGSDLEGICLLSPTELLLVSDNDFGCEGASTGFWRVTFDNPLY